MLRPGSPCCGVCAARFPGDGRRSITVSRGAGSRACARSRGPPEWVLADMREFMRPAAFGLACSMFTSLGYFAEEADDLQLLRNVRQSLVPGGPFVIEMRGKEQLARVWKDAICTEFPDGTVWLQRPQVRNDWTRIGNEWILMRDGKYRSYVFEHTVYSGRELKDRLLLSGFQEVRLFGDLSGSRFGLDSTRLVAVARA